MSKDNRNKEAELLCVLADISSMCVGEIAMGYRLDAQYIGEIIYQATGMTQPELSEYNKVNFLEKDVNEIIELGRSKGNIFYK